MRKVLIDHKWVRYQCEACLKKDSDEPCVLFLPKACSDPEKCTHAHKDEDGNDLSNWREMV
jgi:hypothetical protein